MASSSGPPIWQSRGKPDRFLGEIGDALEIAHKMTAERPFHLEAGGRDAARAAHWIREEPMARRRISDRLRSVTIGSPDASTEPFRGIGGMPAFFTGVLRAPVICRTISVIGTAIFIGVAFSVRRKWRTCFTSH